MNFLVLKDGKTSVALSEVRLAEETRGELVQLTMKDGSCFETYHFLWVAAVQRIYQHVVPAAPQTYLVCLNEDGTYEAEMFEPVIGWAVHAAGGVQPLIHYGTPDEDSPHVLHPDGRVTNSGGGVYKSLEEYVEFHVQAESLAAE